MLKYKSQSTVKVDEKSVMNLGGSCYYIIKSALRKNSFDFILWGSWMSLPNFMAKYILFSNLDQPTKGSQTWIWLNSWDDICPFVLIFLFNHIFVKLRHNGNLATSPGQYMCLPHCSLQVIYLYFKRQVLTVYDSCDQNVRKKVTLQTYLRIFCC